MNACVWCELEHTLVGSGWTSVCKLVVMPTHGIEPNVTCTWIWECSFTQLRMKKKNTRIVCSPSKLKKIQWNTTDKDAILNYKNKRTNSNPFGCSIISYRFISDLYIYDAIPHGTIQFITLLPINSIKTIDDKLAMNCLYRLISMPIMLKIYLNGYLHFRYVHTCDSIKLIKDCNTT